MSKKILVLISGSGTNLQAIIDACASGKITAGHVSQVISSHAGVRGLQRAEEAKIPTHVHQLKDYYKGIPKEKKEERVQAREKFNKELAEYILQEENKPDLVVCAGWMIILSPAFLEPLAKQGVDIINLHPALPGAFAGINAIQRAWKAGQDGEIDKGGVMIHKVIAEVDEGKPLLVKEIPLKKEETVEEYEARVHVVEHEAIVEGTIIALGQNADEEDEEDDESPKKRAKLNHEPENDGNKAVEEVSNDDGKKERETDEVVTNEEPEEVEENTAT